MRIVPKLTFSTFAIAALVFGCAGKEEQMEDALSSDFSDESIDNEFDYFGDSFSTESVELTDGEGMIDDGSAFGDLDPYSDTSAGSDLGYDNNEYAESNEAFEVPAETAPYDSYESVDSYNTAEFEPEPALSTTTTTMPMTENHSRGRYVVQPGDTLAVIARRVYGDIDRWRDLAEQNSISNPSRIYPGDVIHFDSSDRNGSEYASRMETGFQHVTVRSGDTLSSIAARVFGTTAAWKYLWRFNEDSVANPNRIYVGQQLRYKEFDRNGRRIAH